MLIRFSFKNFKSFKNENCLDMEATSLKEHEYNISKTGKAEVLKVAAIYGANASGKTNVLQAFDYMKTRILVNDDSIRYYPMDNENCYSFMINEEPIALEVEIIAKNNKIYKYGFEILKDKIISEWLYVKKINTYSVIFERKNKEIKLTKNKEKFNVDENTLFLNLYSKLHSTDEDFSSVYNWFMNANYLDLGDPDFESFLNNRVSLSILSNYEYKKELLKFIKAFDLGIEGIKTTPESIDMIKNTDTEIKVELIHKSGTNTSKALPFELESNGTIKMFHLFDFFMEALKMGRVLFIDELDAKLHPLLTKYIINLFHNPETNIGNGQLIYSTHDTVNLNKDTFRRDEIWFAEKDKNGMSTIYSLSDYKINDTKVRNDATYNKDYLSGRYGAIPVLEDFNIVKSKDARGNKRKSSFLQVAPANASIWKS